MSVAESSLVALRFPVNARLPDTTITPLSAEAIRDGAPRVVTKPETMNFRTMLPEPGGMYDPKLFGPGTVVDAPPVQLDEPFVARKTHFARITLAVPILHPLFGHHARAEVAALLGDDSYDVLRAITSLEHGRALVAALSSSAYS